MRKIALVAIVLLVIISGAVFYGFLGKTEAIQYITIEVESIDNIELKIDKNGVDPIIIFTFGKTAGSR